MPSIPLAIPDDLALFIRPDTTAHLTYFFNPQTQANEYLVVVFSTNGFGGKGEQLAHLRLSKELFDKLAEQYPLAEKHFLMRSLDFSVQAAQQMLSAHWPPESSDLD